MFYPLFNVVYFGSVDFRILNLNSSLPEYWKALRVGFSDSRVRGFRKKNLDSKNARVSTMPKIPLEKNDFFPKKIGTQEFISGCSLRWAYLEVLLAAQFPDGAQ